MTDISNYQIIFNFYTWVLGSHMPILYITLEDF